MTDISEILDLVQAIKTKRETNKLFHYKPYAYQKKFHSLKDVRGDLATIRVLQAANQVGKCATIRSFIDHPDGSRSTVGDLFRAGRPFPVLAWANDKPVPAHALAPFAKSAEPCVRLWFRSGHWFECALNHRLLSVDGSYFFADHFLAGVPCLHPRNSLRGPLVRAANALRWSRIRSGFLAYCLAGLRLCDARLHALQVSAQGIARRLADVPRRSFVLCAPGEYSSRHTNICPPAYGRLSSRGAVGRFLGRRAASLCHSFGRFSQRTSASILEFQRLAIAAIAQPRLSDEGAVRQVFPVACHGSNNEGNHIIAYEPIGVHDVYDFTVPQYENYCASGTVHHNSFGGAMEVAIHATGLYPDWWEGHRFTKKTDIMVGSKTNEAGRDICQKELFGDPDTPDALGTGTVPKHLIGESSRKPGVPNAFSSVLVKHVSGGWSKVSFRAYEQGPEKHMGIRIDFGWEDEEPPHDIHSQYVRATLSTGGKLILTFTPENGITQVVHHFMNDIQPGEAMMTASWEDADHFKDPKVREEKLKLISPHEREMRSRGIPVMGSGLVFPVVLEDITIDPFEIPKHYSRICGIDFGYDHPFAAAWLAYDRESDTVYLYDTYRESKTTPPIHAAAINAKSSWIPVAWPHDGLAHDKGSGVPLADQYRNLGVNMLKEKFSNPPAPGQDEGRGGQGVEVGLMEMLTRMETGRFKVFAHCKEFLEECRIYHRKDGNLVKLYDDTISATRYAVMSLRHAQTQVVKMPRQKIMAGVSNW